ncbi:CHASE3 domain-containing protein [Pontibacter ummariensis]|uniref:histidine kinase n=1 Tax=Pontibacter ummariensis TaxID=1610492 RepID=A0A239CSA7_9BACT|nr:ATP-binding protein [Pontibacter ummariensis]PRY14856.1 CHASE3 domain-containing protein [Pontibacter ummariensis]SNS22977.1 CHASE3 domain-containing protein [Pontibacter ummariensis]
MKKLGDSIRVKVVIGFGLALSIFVFAIYLTYTSFTQLLHSVNVLSKPNRKLIELQHTLATISTAESAIRAYTLTTKEEHFKSYLCHLDTIQNQIDSLQLLMKNSPQELAQVDSVSALLKEKQKSMERFVALKKQQKKNNYSNKALQQIASTAEEKPLATTITQHTTTTISDRLSLHQQEDEQKETRREKEKPRENKRGLFSRIFSKKEKQVPEDTMPPKVIVPQLNVTREVAIDTSASTAPVAPLAKVRRILHNVQREADQKEEQLEAEELALLQNDKQIMDQVRDMMYKLEHYEQDQARQNAEQVKAVAHETSVTLLIIGLLGLGSGGAFMLLILRDVTRSDNYKSRLIKAQKEAVQLARAKEAFVANMSHEMRTPLNVILGFTQQLNHTALDTQQQEHLQAVNGAGQHLLHIVNDVLDLSKIEAGKLDITPTPFSLKQLLTEVEQAFALKASSKHIAFKCQAEETIPDALQGDVLRLKQVMFNLVDNAIKFTHEGQVQVNAKLKSRRRSRVVVSITVADTGIGIPEERLQHVFGEFNQADDSILRKYGGTGLGLSISKKLVEIQGGTLSVSSQHNRGTAFTVVLPLQESKETVPATPAVAVPQAPAFNGYTALVVDDDAYSRTLCNLILSRWGIEVHLANDGQEALALVQQHQYDVVLTDIQLPGMSGKTVARNIRKQDKKVPIIALTANVLSNDSDFFKNTPIKTHLLKPYTEQELHQKLAETLPTLPVTIAPDKEQVEAQPNEPTGETGLYSLHEMRLFTGQDNQTLAAVLEVLLADQQQSLEQLSAVAKQEDWEKAGNIAHKMLTGFRHLQAYTVIPHLQELEQVLHGAKANTKDLQKVVAETEQKTQRVLAALQKELEALRRSVAQQAQAIA